MGGNRIEKLTNIKSNAKDKEMRLKELLAKQLYKINKIKNKKIIPSSIKYFAKLDTVSFK